MTANFVYGCTEDADLYSQNIELQQVKMAPEEQRGQVVYCL